MTAIVGLDISSTSTGIAMTGAMADIATVRLVRPRIQDPYDRLAAMGVGVAAVLNHAQPQLAIIEAYMLGGLRGYAALRLSETGGLVRLMLRQRSVPWVEVPVSQLKQYATGSGGADKAAMVAAARDELGYLGRSNDEADALWLHRIGADQLDGSHADARRDLEALRARIRGSLIWPVLREAA